MPTNINKRLDDLRDLLKKRNDAEGKISILEVYCQDPEGNEYLSTVFDIRTCEVIYDIKHDRAA